MDKACSACACELGNHFRVTCGNYFFGRKEKCVCFLMCLVGFPGTSQMTKLYMIGVGLQRGFIVKLVVLRLQGY